jgi:hypothetical protein
MFLARSWSLLRATVEGFIEDEAMTRGAAIACYTLFSVAPLLVVAVAIAATVFTEAAVWDAVTDQLRALVGNEGAAAVRGMVSDASTSSGLPATLGIGLLLLTASGVFAEIQAALNVIWKTMPKALSLSYLVRARLLSIGLVATTGFLLLVSLGERRRGRARSLGTRSLPGSLDADASAQLRHFVRSHHSVVRGHLQGPPRPATGKMWPWGRLGPPFSLRSGRR